MKVFLSHSGLGTGSSSAVQQLLDALAVVGRDLGAAVEPPGALRRLVLEQVPTIGLLAHDFSGSGQPEPLGSAAVGLRLGHLSSVLLSQFCDTSGSSGAACSLGASACCAALARVFAPRCGASTIVMLRPSCLADVSRIRIRRRRRPAAAAIGSPAQAAT